jgi:anti-sigma factor RsiW
MNDKDILSSQYSLFEFHDCKDVVAHLGDFVEGDLPLAQRAAVENHLDECSDCATFYASYKHVISSAAELREPNEPLPVEVSNRLRKALNARLGLNLTLSA